MCGKGEKKGFTEKKIAITHVGVCAAPATFVKHELSPESSV